MLTLYKATKKIPNHLVSGHGTLQSLLLLLRPLPHFSMERSWAAFLFTVPIRIMHGIIKKQTV